MAKKIVGVFENEREASLAIQNLQSQGFTSDEISVVAKDRDDLRAIDEETGTKAPEGLAAGAATGGVLGGVTGLLAGVGALAIPGIGPILAAGPLAATLAGLAVGAGAGGLVGGLVGLGIPEDEAKEYEGYLDRGNILVLVDEDQRSGSVYNSFRDNRSLNANRYHLTEEGYDNRMSTGETVNPALDNTRINNADPALGALGEQETRRSTINDASEPADTVFPPRGDRRI
ncbi:general stress protein [Saccharibacillus sp. CPCC 101409]|uniref:general stress protein n=1 Tax=Saccharibacillus sp. CPCC 101409 TaxID=3058041 RepID=UPI002673BC3A|nr:general stress protein [Saccharibacillus sp. CPCC 101409]MDO3411693.1 general stress protein [Saccharibacillus sp. CPCC 101409]